MCWTMLISFFCQFCSPRLMKHSSKVGKAAVDTADDDGWTPLIIAASAGHNQLVEMLLANGANVNATTSQVGKRHCANVINHSANMQIASVMYHDHVAGAVCPFVLCQQGKGRVDCPTY